MTLTEPQFQLRCRKTMYLEPQLIVSKSLIDRLKLSEEFDFLEVSADVLSQSQELSFHRIYLEDDFAVLDSMGSKLRIDFDRDHLNYRRQGLRGKNELIIKALGVGSSKGVPVLDLSAGLGIDAVMISQLGYQVTAVERSLPIYLLLKFAHQMTQQNELDNLKFVFSDSLNFLENTPLDHYQAIYFDPMYPHEKNKTALPKKEMVLFRNLVGDDSDATTVLEVALQKTKCRIAVKRPVHAPSLLGKVGHSFIGKAVRYDSYMAR